jgi:hypothetical protein
MKKMFKITTEIFDDSVRGEHPVNNPVVTALKRQVFPDARSIFVHGNDVVVDGEMWTLCIDGVRLLNQWNAGKRVEEQYLTITS